MKLYYAPGACSLSVNIALREAGIKFDMTKVDLKSKQTANGDDYYAINPKGYVPAIDFGNGKLLTEANVILQWIAEQVPEKNIFPKATDPKRFEALEWLSYVATELHKGFGGLFHPNFSEEGLKNIHSRLQMRLKVLDQHLEGKKFILGENVSIVDMYAFNILRWAPAIKVDLTSHHNILRLVETMRTLDSVNEAMRSEK